MYISMNWIGDFVDLSGLDLESLIHRFTLSTAEVEDIFHKGDDLRDVVAGKILSVEAHPNSKKLHLLKVDAGNKIYDVVCGAPNVREGLIVPFVKEGGMVAGQEIACASIAGMRIPRHVLLGKRAGHLRRPLRPDGTAPGHPGGQGHLRALRH